MKRSRWRTTGLVAITATVAALLSIAGLSQTRDQNDRAASLSAPVASAVPAAGVGAAMPGAGTSFADVIERVSPAVVTISVTKGAATQPTAAQVPPQTPFGDFFRYFGAPNGAPFNAPMRAEGSGFIIDSNGYIATNQHVIDAADKITVKLQSGEELPGKLVGQDSRTDLAVVKVDGHNLPTVAFGDSDKARVGDWVVAIGDPFGLGGTATAGIISARGRDINSGPYDNYLQIDAPINSGNSGGPIFNVRGEVVGINTAIFSPNGGNIGIGFAIPSNQARGVIEQIEAHGTIKRGWLGVEIQTVDDAVSKALGLDKSVGVLVTQVVPDGPADRAGIRAGDLITEFDHKSVGSARDLGRDVADRSSGERVDVQFMRDGHAENATVELGQFDAPEQVARNDNDNGFRSFRFGRR